MLIRTRGKLDPMTPRGRIGLGHERREGGRIEAGARRESRIRKVRKIKESNEWGKYEKNEKRRWSHERKRNGKRK